MRPKDLGSSGSGTLLTTRLLQWLIPYACLAVAERQVANKEDQERAYQELADSLSEEDRRFLQHNARKRKWKVGVRLLMIALPSFLLQGVLKRGIGIELKWQCSESWIIFFGRIRTKIRSQGTEDHQISFKFWAKYTKTWFLNSLFVYCMCVSMVI